MATTNQRNRSGGKGSTSAQSIPGKARKAVSQASNKMADVRDEVSGYVSQGYEQFGQMTRGHEGQAVLIALAAGFGVGFVIGCSLASANRRPQTWHERITAEGIGRKIMDRIERMMPETIAEHFGR